jgi:hypothetical protein
MVAQIDAFEECQMLEPWVRTDFPPRVPEVAAVGS